jgi:hypothetical protein
MPWERPSCMFLAAMAIRIFGDQTGREYTVYGKSIAMVRGLPCPHGLGAN